MRFATFADASGTRPGIIEGDRVRPIRCDSLIEYISLEPSARAGRHDTQTLPFDAVALRAPVRPRKNVMCVGRNYLEHAKEGARALGKELNLPEVPTFFTKATTAIADPNATLAFDRRVSVQFDWEAELAIVIGKRAKDVNETAAGDAIFGYTCLNDITARDLQRSHHQWFKGKSIDASCPIGPWIVTAGELGDAQRLDVTLRVNNIVKQRSNTARMIFSLTRLVSVLSRGMTLEPGDVIATGTPEGVGFARTPPEFFTDGDVVEVEIENIGVLRNTIQLV